ncbi:MAG: glycosyltransferase family 1 protein [Desulfobacteraceae bacterium]|nr:MAG: glycosyltransferase family 1 protein [Desulfobacteraceae bacterium]
MSDPITPAIWFLAIRCGSGADVFTKNLAKGLRNRGLRTEITWLPHRAEYAPWTVAVPKPPEWANIAHINTWLPGRFFPTEIPLVATMHHCVHDRAVRPYKSWAQIIYHCTWVKRVEKNVLQRAIRTVAVSEYTAQRTLETYGIPGITVIHNGIGINGVFQAPLHRKIHRPFRLLYIGNWLSRKGVDLLGPIMQALGPAFELRYTIGKSATSRSYRLPPNTRNLGGPKTTASMVEIYRDADALLLPSRLEGFGLVALEAQACGLPVIATRGSALPEVIEDGVTGILCAQDDVQAFAAAARRLSEDPALCRDMQRAARSRVERYFGSEIMVGRYIEVYHEALRSRSFS